MATYLVMKNNLKRAFGNKLIYIAILVVPALIVLVGIISTRLSTRVINIGLVNENDGVIMELDSYDNVRYEVVDSNSYNADYIMGKYDYVLDLDNSREVLESMTQIKENIQKNSNRMQPSKLERQFALLMTAYLVIATMYASKYICDKADGLVERFNLGGNRGLQYIKGYVLSTFILVFIQVSIAAIFFTVLNKASEINILKLCILSVTISLIASTFGVMCSIIAKREMTANLTASSLAVLATIIGGSFTVVDEMPLVLRYVSLFSPVRWIVELL